jgi:Domain of unknown function (DUF4253)
MEVSKWVCGDRQGTLNPAPEPVRDFSDQSVQTLVAKLTAANIDVSTLGRLNWPLIDIIYALEVQGDQAERIWKQLRGISLDTGYWPIIVSDEDELDGLVDNISCHLEFDSDSKTWAPRKKAYNSSDMIIDETDSVARVIGELRGLEGASEPLDSDGSGVIKPGPVDFIVVGEKLDMGKWLDLKCAVNQEIDEEFEESDWPFDVMPDNNLQALQTWDPETGSRELETVFVLLIKADYSWEVPAKLLYGGWNECPVPQVHVGFSKRWFKMHDAEIISIGRATIEMFVGKPPITRDEALELAREHFVYCPDCVDQGAGSVPSLAAELLNGLIWHFWWD